MGAAANMGVSRSGNSRKNMMFSVEQSLKRLKTDHIDLYWVHLPDQVTPIEEIMQGLNDLVRVGKVLYIGLSDFPAWRVSRGALLAELRGWAPLVFLNASIAYQYGMSGRLAGRGWQLATGRSRQVCQMVGTELPAI